MSAYLVTRDGQELGSFELSQIKAGLRTGQLKDSDWGWCEGMEDWKALTEIAGPAAVSPVKSISSPSSAPISNSGNLTPAGINPYAAPSANLVRAAATGEVPYDVVVELKGTKPWVRFISILGWIMCSFFGLGIIFSLIPALSTKAPVGGPELAIIILGGGLVMFLMLYPTLKLSKYATHISRLVESNSPSDLVEAMREQKRVWKFYGVVAAIYLSFFLMMFFYSLMTRRPF